VVYADDTTLLFQVPASSCSIGDLANVGASIEKAISHFNKFGLVVNSSKTTLVLFHNPQRKLITDSMSIEVMGQNIPLSYTAKCLGITLHDHMKWEPHLIPFPGSAMLLLLPLRDSEGLVLTPTFLSRPARSQRALFEPVLTYCVACWGSSVRNVLRVAQVLQNDAIRAIKGLPRIASVSTWYSKF
jgi:hypothetical protein